MAATSPTSPSEQAVGAITDCASLRRSERDGTQSKVIGGLVLFALLAVGTLCTAAPGLPSTPTSSVDHAVADAGGMGTSHSRALYHLDGYSKHNTAVIVVRPHAATHAATRMVNKILKKAGISVVRRTRLNCGVVNDREIYDDATEPLWWKLYDWPNRLDMPEDKAVLFASTFGEIWDDVRYDDSKFMTISDLSWSLDIDVEDLAAEFYELEEGVGRIHVGYGFDVGKLRDVYLVSPNIPPTEWEYEDDDLYTNVLEVMWKPSDLSFMDYLTTVIGTATPEKSHPSSIRHQLYLHWQNLSLSHQPNGMWYGVESSENLYASMLEAAVWFEDNTMADHPLYKNLESRGVDFSKVPALWERPFITYRGYDRQFYDFLHGLDRKAFTQKFVDIMRVLGRSDLD